MGTGGALNNLKNKKINDFILINGDSILDVNYLKLININKNKIVSIYLTKNINYKSNNKLANLSLKNKIVRFSNKKDFMNGGIYFFKKKILNFIPSKKFSLENDLLEKLISEKKINGFKNDNFFRMVLTKFKE